MQCSSPGKVLAYYTQSSGFDPKHRIDQAWWYKPVILPLWEVEAGRAEVQSHPRFQIESFRPLGTHETLSQ